ncbi:MAG TPA: OmpH family outer membrane protein [Thermotogota bacterium]|nr:OmpH family outer membrane protein [Thermotogota bacterium]HPJ88510.1 OmpH family outer membrane protein [Thermotogota bacterium]HPR96210.1 OmpH family outer membrane protein [Thermotogota bacterium]
MKKVILLSVLITVLFAFTAVAGTPFTASARQPVIAFIDFDIAGQEFIEAKNLMEEYQADAEYYNSLLKPLEDEIVKMQSAGDQTSQSFQLKVNEYQLQKDKYTSQIQNKYTSKFEDVNQRLLDLAAEYAKIKNIDVLLTDKVSVYTSDDYDLTEDFVTYANSKAQY